MDTQITSFDALYNRRYKDNIENDKEREKLVGKLMLPALKNDQSAIKKIIELMIDPSFAVIRNTILKYGDLYRSLDLMEDMMQEVAGMITKCFFRGISESVKEEELLKYLLGMIRHSTQKILDKNYKREALHQSIENEEENKRVQQMELMEEETEEERKLKNDMIAYFIQCLMETEVEPHKVVTYSYASLLPMIFKGTQNEKVLLKMDKMSGRKYEKKTSSFKWNSRKERFELTGEISRSGDKLMKWAIDVMYDMSVDFLQNEVQDIYNMEPIGNITFMWGSAFCKNLDKMYDKNRRERDIVITSEFTELTMKNWPVRLGASLYKKTRKHFIEEVCYEEVALQYNRTKLKE